MAEVVAAQDGKQSLVNPAFIALMEHELGANGHKGDWRAWEPTKLEAVSELHWHVSKLIRALNEGKRAEVSEFAADVANIAMKTSEVHGDV